MTPRSTVWRVVALVAAALFALVNLVGGVYAAGLGELPHAGLHAALLVLGAYPLWRLAPRRDAGGGWRWTRASPPTHDAALSDRLGHLERAVDAVAIDVERIGEGQRFVTRLFAERVGRSASGAAAEPTPRNAHSPPPVGR